MTHTWSKIERGMYQTTDRKFQAKHRCDGGWMLLIRNDDVIGNWDWCQTFNSLNDAKVAASLIVNEA